MRALRISRASQPLLLRLSNRDLRADIHLAALRLTDDALTELGLKAGGRSKFRQLSLDLRGSDVSRLDLGGLDLSRLDLAGCNLSGCNLSGTTLSGANTTGATLTGVKLSVAQLLEVCCVAGADLGGMDLSKRDLSKKDLSGCNLSGCNLSGANLSGANLAGANLSGARLRGARMDKGTRLEGAAGWPADTGAEGVVRGARVLTTEDRHAWGSGAPRTGVVSDGPDSDGDIKVTWDATGRQSGGFKASTAVLLTGS